MKNKVQQIIYYTSEDEEFSKAQITPRTIDGDYKYLGGPLRGIGRLFWYHIVAKPLALIFLKLRFGHRIVNKECLKKVGDTGYIMYGNHTNDIADALIPSMIAPPKGTYVIVHPNNVSMPVLGRITPSLGALPLPDDKEANRNFTYTIDKLVRRKKIITIYPEAHIWPYYTGIRSFGDAAFRYPVKYKVPVYVFTNTYQKRKYRKTPRIVTYVDGPFYPEENLSVKEQRLKLHKQTISSMRLYSKNSNIEVIKYVKRED